MKLRLRAKYTLLLGGLVLSATITVAIVFLFQANALVNRIHQNTTKSAHEGLVAQMQLRGQNLVGLLATFAVEPLRSERYDQLYTPANATLSLHDVDRVEIFDRTGILVHESQKPLAPSDKYAGKKQPARSIIEPVLRKGQWVIKTSSGLMTVSGPIISNHEILGAVTLTLRNDMLKQHIAVMEQQQRNIWKAGMARFFGVDVVVLLLLLLMSILAGAVAGRRLSEPIETLAAAARRIGSGRYDVALPPAGNDEIGDLASALDRMAKDLQRTTVSKNYLDSIIGNMNEGLIVADQSGAIEKANAAACALLDCTEPELVGRPLDSIIPCASKPGSPENQMAGGNGNTLVVIKTFSNKSLPILAARSTIKLDDGDISKTCVVFSDITEFNQRENELRAARDEAQVANQAKSQFLATMSHELRTPLNAIIGFSSMLKGQIGGPLSEKYQSYAVDIHDSAAHLLMLINDLLDISKLEAGKMDVAEENMELSEVVNASVRLIRDKSADRRITITVTGIEETPPLYGDKRMLKQMITNLLSNAYKFNVDGGMITVTASFIPNIGLDLAVADSGIGIAEEDIGRIAQPFAQIENHMSRVYQGTGLGLAITKSMIELHGGNISIRSRQGEGTTVTLHFPPHRVESRNLQMPAE